VRQVIGGRKEEIAAWMKARLPGFTVWTPYEAIGFTDSRGEIIGAVLYDNFVGFNIEMHAAGEGHWLTRTSLAEIFGYPFMQLQCRRVTARVSAKNLRSQRMCEHAGFTLEGRCREGFADGSDLLVYGMLKRECRWLKFRRPSGQILTAQCA
jgi:RimJ/RimL family protein N-acetyltransferase